MGFLKVIKRAPWKKIGKAVLRIVGVPLAMESSGANSEAVEYFQGEHLDYILPIIEGILGYLQYLLSERKLKRKQADLEDTNPGKTPSE